MTTRLYLVPRAGQLLCMLTLAVCSAAAQIPAPAAPPPVAASQTAPSTSGQQVPASPTPASSDPASSDPAAPIPAQAIQPTDQPATRQPAPNAAIVNHRPYLPPTAKEQFIAYLKDSYGLPALAGASVRSTWGQIRTRPEGWGQDWPGFGQRFGSSLAIGAINGNVRYGLETVFHEDMRYIPCHGCSVKRKIENTLLAEITARHASDGHRFFTLTPTVADFSGPILANTFWFPAKYGPVDGVVSARLVFATRIGGHLFREFVLERRHNDPRFDD